MEELGAGDGSVAPPRRAQLALHRPPLDRGDREQKGRWLPPLARGAYLGCWALTSPRRDPMRLNTQSRSRRDGDEYVLSGQSNSSPTGPSPVSRSRRGAGDASSGVRDSARYAGLRVGRREEKMACTVGYRAARPRRLSRFPGADRIGRDGKRSTTSSRVLDRGRVGIGGARDRARPRVSRDRDRVREGAEAVRKAIGEFEMIQWRLAARAPSSTRLRLLVHRAAVLADAGPALHRCGFERPSCTLRSRDASADSSLRSSAGTVTSRIPDRAPSSATSA